MDLDNPGRLKLDLLYYGVRPAAGTEIPDDPSGTLIMALPEDVWANVTYRADYVAKSPFELRRQGRQWILSNGSEEITVQVLKPLKAYKKTTSSGIPISDILYLHGGFIALEPMGLCRFTKSGLECKYCRHKGPTVKTSFTTKDVMEALELVKKEVPVDIIHLSSGFVESEDGGVLSLEPLVHEIRKYFNVFISIDVMPPAHNDWIDRTYAMGVDAVYYDIDVFDPDLFASLYPEKEEAVRHQRYIEAMEYAARTFPSGAVATHLVVGLESLASTRKGIKTLTEIGVLPLLTFFRPMTDSVLRKKWSIQTKDLIPLYRELFEQVKHHRINPNWIRQFDVVMTPLEGRFFAAGQRSWRVAQQNFYKTALGRKTALGLATIRRNLRVREIKKPQ